jgi:Flp pilus assembly protein TadD
MRAHRHIWVIALAAAVIAAVALAGRWHMTRGARETLLRELYAALEDDPRARDDSTRQLAGRVEALLVDAPHAPEGWYARGVLLRGDRRYGDAETAFREALRLRPDWARAWNGLGVALYSIERAAEAEEALREAVRLDPEWSRAWNDLAVVLRFEGRLDEALPAAKKAVAFAPESVAAHNNLGNLLTAMGRLDEAETAYLEALGCAPDHPAPHYNLACLSSRTGRPGEALDHLARAVTGNPAYRLEAEADPDLDNIRDDPRFRALMGGDPAAPTP